MSAEHETAYPRLKSDLTKAELDDVYTPSSAELTFARRHTKNQTERFVLLVQLKTIQRLGYFLQTTDVPTAITDHIAQKARLDGLRKSAVRKLDRARIRERFRDFIRKRLKIKAFERGGLAIVEQTAASAAATHHELPDIINAAIEELVHLRFELPGFSTLQRAARHARADMNTHIYSTLAGELTNDRKAALNRLLVTDSSSAETQWQRLKREPRKPTNQEVRHCIEHLIWLKEWINDLPAVSFIPSAKWRQFVLEARSYDAASLKRMKANKRYALMVILFHAQLRRSNDDIVTVLLRKVGALHNNAKQQLAEHHLERARNIDNLIGQFRDVLNALIEEGSDAKRIAAIHQALTASPQQLLDECDQHLAYEGDNYIPFMLSPYQAQRPILLNCLELLNVQSSSNDQSLVAASRFVLANRRTRSQTIPIPRDLSLHWIPDKWRKPVTGNTSAEATVTAVDRKYFELCVLSRVATELKTVDLYVEHSEDYGDYREQLVPWVDYHEQIDEYCELLDHPNEPADFVDHLRESLVSTASKIDQEFPDNAYVDIDDTGLIIRKHGKPTVPSALKALDQAITDHLQEQNILSVLIEAEHWLDLHKKFGPLSGFDAKIDEPRKRFITTLFCYGCNLGPVQTARSIKELSRKQVAWLNLHHVTEERLDKAITAVINAYNKFHLPKCWGSGKTASADGTKWNLYEQNLLSEYHIRYGGYGGIGYYHVSDKYIALFSRFIPCGTYEAIYILDGLMKNESDIQPDTVHGDTHAQSYPVFGLAHLLGIKLMPRIRKPKRLNFYRPNKKARYRHIDSLFSETINWQLIKTHLPDMLRIALSIKAGKISPSMILRRLSTRNQKNKLYFAFRELGRAVRTEFLLNYIGDIEVRKMVQSATTKSEEFNQFASWLLFGGDGVIAENLRHEQRKIIKYNHLAANLVILHNVNAMTRILSELHDSGQTISEELVAGLAPYRVSHINRFGDYSLSTIGSGTRMEFRTNLFH